MFFYVTAEHCTQSLFLEKRGEGPHIIIVNPKNVFPFLRQGIVRWKKNIAYIYSRNIMSIAYGYMVCVISVSEWCTRVDLCEIL